MDYPHVKITELEEKQEGFCPKVSVGATSAEEIHIEMNTKLVLLALASASKKFYLLEWEGNKIPRGAVIEGKTISWTQNGIVMSTDGKQIGTYERTVEFGGPSGREQKMIVFAD